MDCFSVAFSTLQLILMVGKTTTSDLSQADFIFRLAFALPLSTPISLPLPSLATFLDTLGGLLNLTGQIGRAHV